jgi:hypothetical protein
MGDQPGIPLAGAIQDLRAELLAALSEGAGKDLHFRLKPIELELELAITGSGGGKGGVKFWIVEFCAEAKVERKTTHKLKLVLEPVGKNGGSFEVSALGAAALPAKG